MAVTIYGYGYVGKAVAAFLQTQYTVYVVEPNTSVTSTASFGRGAAHFIRCAAKYESSVASDYAVICVPTPSGALGHADTSFVERIVDAANHQHYLIKSTVPPGTTDRLHYNLSTETGCCSVCFSPEYIGEGNYPVPYWDNVPHPTDMLKHQFHIFGGEPAVTSKWVELWQRVAGWSPRYVQCSAMEAELTKYAENMFLATKVVFCNELFSVCQAFGADYNAVRELWLLDGRMHPSMTVVYPQQRGFQGKCLPKDTAAIVMATSAAGYQPQFWNSVITNNSRLLELSEKPKA